MSWSFQIFFLFIHWHLLRFEWNFYMNCNLYVMVVMVINYVNCAVCKGCKNYGDK